ncbi:MAG: nucleotidyltransferase domain-containing protein [Candidatus Latescibacterota bacterium]
MGPTRLETRRQEACLASERCAAALRERFGARRVVLFGSAAGDGPWHERSDLDLAVEGLSPAALRAAEGYLESLVPAWLRVDLVPVEHAAPAVLARILGEKTMPPDALANLTERVAGELASVERVVAGLQDALGRTGERVDEFGARALASYVEDFYSGCERMCQRVALALDGTLPAGEEWHRQLLRQMGQPGGGGRPAVFDAPLLLDLDEYRRFRHRSRHLYGYELEAERVLSLARGVEPLFVQVREAVGRFAAWCGSAAAP